MARMTIADRKARNTRYIAAGAFTLGAVASVAANVVAAEPTVIGRAVSAWPAIALLFTVHLFQHANRSVWVKGMVAIVAGVAAWISYWHMVTVATMAGEGAVSAHLLPFTVDAMMAVATVVLTTKPKPARRPAKRPARKATVTPLRNVSGR
jgi:apolipoprotein N-acyltransferase